MKVAKASLILSVLSLVLFAVAFVLTPAPGLHEVGVSLGSAAALIGVSMALAVAALVTGIVARRRKAAAKYWLSGVVLSGVILVCLGGFAAVGFWIMS